MTPRKQLAIKNKVREYCERNNISENIFISKCLASPLSTETGRSLTASTVTRIYDGDASISLQTAGLVASALGVQISDLFEVG